MNGVMYAVDPVGALDGGKYGEPQLRRWLFVEIESWRDALARNLCLRNERLTDRELNFAVQRIIDRIIFLRMCEWRDIEPFGQFKRS